MYIVPKWVAQAIVQKAEQLPATTVKIFVVDLDGTYTGKWTAHGLVVSSESLDRSEVDYLRLNWFSKPHIGLWVMLSPYITLLIGVWSPSIASLTEMYLKEFTEETPGLQVPEEKELSDVK